VAAARVAFSALDVHLVLLRRMADLQAPLVEDALRRLGVGRSDMRDANRRWNAARFGRPGAMRLGRFARALGEPDVDRAAAVALAGRGLRRSCWPMDLWPGLWLQVLADDRDVVWHLGLTRAAGTPTPLLRRASDVAPWTCVLAECAAAFDDVTFHDVGLTGHEAITCTAAGDDGRPARWLVRSVWGLVQRVEPSAEGVRTPG
jgi:hypothetical protein